MGFGVLDIAAEALDNSTSRSTGTNKIRNNADSGCTALNCDNSVACQAFHFGCVQNLLSSTQAIANDGEIAACELIQNSLDPRRCFN